MKILVIEDEIDLLNSVSNNLKNEGMVVEKASDYNSSIEKLEIYHYDIVILDLTLPGGNGLDILKRIKQKKLETGVIIISARNSLNDKLIGLDIGADDYLTKPFYLAELNSRIAAVSRRLLQNGMTILQFKEIEIETENRIVKVYGNPIDLTKKEYDLLHFFAVNINRVLTKETIAEHIWGDYIDNSDNFDFIYSHIKNLRKKIENEGGTNYIKTVYGLGYKMASL